MPEVRECDGCQFEPVECHHYRSGPGARQEEGYWLCDLCAGTLMSTMLDYPSGSTAEDRLVVQAINAAANAILKAIREKGAPGRG